METPTDLSGTGATDGTYDAIYNFGGQQRNVAKAAPGDTDFNGGRWQVHALSFPPATPPPWPPATPTVTA